MWCFKKAKVEKQKIPAKDYAKNNNYVPSSGFHNDIVYYKFLNTDTYELNVPKIQVWIFDKASKCVHSSDNEFKADYYVGKSLSDIVLKEDVLDTFKDIHTLAQTGVESKRTVIINNMLAYIEGRTLYYNEDISDVYGSMLLLIPYKNVVPSNIRSNTSSSYALTETQKNETNRPTSLDITSSDIEPGEQQMRSVSLDLGTHIHKKLPTETSLDVSSSSLYT